MWTSVPQIPVRWTRIKTSLMPKVGPGTSWSQRPGSARALTSAFKGSPDDYGSEHPDCGSMVHELTVQTNPGKWIGELGCELGGWWRSPSDTTTVSIRHSQRSFITPTRTGADSTARNLDHRSLWARGLANSAWPMGSSAESVAGGGLRSGPRRKRRTPHS